MEKQPLTKNEDKVYTFLLTYMEDNSGRAPLLREIADRMGWSESHAKTTAHHTLKSIEKKGWIRLREPRRDIDILG